MYVCVSKSFLFILNLSGVFYYILFLFYSNLYLILLLLLIITYKRTFYFYMYLQLKFLSNKNDTQMIRIMTYYTFMVDFIFNFSQVRTQLIGILIVFHSINKHRGFQRIGNKYTIWVTNFFRFICAIIIYCKNVYTQ